MAAPDVTRPPTVASEHASGGPRIRWRLGAGGARAWLHAYAGIWAITLTVAVLVAVAGPTANRLIRRLLQLRLTPHHNPTPDTWHVLALVAHNIPIAAWPLLLGLAGVQRSRRARACGDCLVLASALANTLPVGAALGAYGVRLVPYIPQLPLEWAGLAAGWAGWAAQREGPLSARERLTWLGLIVALLGAAATLETIAPPHS